MTVNNKLLKEPRQRRYIARDFDSFRAQLVQYARQYYPDKIQDFSENGLGGLFVDLAATVGDNMSFYLDHQFQELDPETAFEDRNVERHIKSAGITISGASPSLVECTFYVQIPAIQNGNSTTPRPDAIPVIQAGTTISSNSGIIFTLLEDIDFRKQNDDGTYVASLRIGKTSPAGNVLTYVMIADGQCVSGEEITETFTIGSFVPFRRITLSNSNVTQVISVSDGLGNDYYEVSALTDDVIYQNISNTRDDVAEVPETIKLLPAPYRFITDVNIDDRKTSLIFGGGSADSLEDDIIPDPSQFAIRFPYRRTFSRQAINPRKMLQTKTLGVAAIDTELIITYRYGGGLDHNAAPGEIITIESLRMFFPNNPTPVLSAQVRASAEVNNLTNASGGEDPPTVDDLRDLVSNIRSSQERIVNREDLLSRVYTLPSNFGRVYRAAVRSNPNNPLATQLFIIARNSDGQLIQASDTLKLNLVRFLNPYRMISDAIDVLDAQVINLEINFEVVVEPALNKTLVIEQVLRRLKNFFRIQNFHIDQPLVREEVRNQIAAIRGVISINSLEINNISGIVANRVYSDRTFDVSSNTFKEIIFPPPGGIFEVRFPDFNITGRAI